MSTHPDQAATPAELAARLGPFLLLVGSRFTELAQCRLQLREEFPRRRGRVGLFIKFRIAERCYGTGQHS